MMALINLPLGYWIDIPEKGYGIDYGRGTSPCVTLEKNISTDRVVELLRETDNDDPRIYSIEEDTDA